MLVDHIGGFTGRGGVGVKLRLAEDAVFAIVRVKGVVQVAEVAVQSLEGQSYGLLFGLLVLLYALGC